MSPNQEWLERKCLFNADLCNKALIIYEHVPVLSAPSYET